MLGMSYYQCGVYSQVPSVLGRVTAETTPFADAYLHMGLSYLQLADNDNAYGFRAGCRLHADMKVKGTSRL